MYGHFTDTNISFLNFENLSRHKHASFSKLMRMGVPNKDAIRILGANLTDRATVDGW